MTWRSPFGSATEYEPWSKSQSLGLRPGSKKSPKKQRPGAVPLISSGVDHDWPPSVDMEPKMGDEQKFSSPVGGCPQFGLNLKTVHVRETLPAFGLCRYRSAEIMFLSCSISMLLSSTAMKSFDGGEG